MADHPTWMTTLWPDATVHDRWTAGTRRWIAVPNPAAPTQVLPFGFTSIVGAAGRASDDRSRRRQVRDGLGVAALLALAPLRSGQRMSVGSAGLDLATHVRQQLNLPQGATIILCGPARANQKPILQLLDRRGRTAAFVKVAWNDLTRSLLDSESAALAHLADRADGFHVPPVLGRGSNATGSWLAIGPVGVARRRRPSTAAIDALAIAIQGTSPRTTADVDSSPFVARLHVAAEPLERTRPVVKTLIEQHRSVPLSLAACHGDFVPWNILSGDPVPAVWDWERYDPQAPVGVDRLHHRLQLAIQRQGRTVQEAATQLREQIDAVLPDLDHDQRRAHLDFYLADLLCRYEHDLLLNPADRLRGRVEALTAMFEQRGG